ncbi:hypothetical protein H7849_06745 [Alloacidobacterium dinghuense]|uniref:Uncharacterized protein n=1 Tax=Alloacidobacterium dinghuense TaxID=2763107 RepID=A0A7G8BM57_9BACT|nr:hypothetical protein [Alloacidobacterium dinghuense]QNI33627.1 hypothetical protein H7849_06745 [Alloacidobacterium dinghuense]
MQVAKFFSENWGNLASVIGLVLSGVAALFSRQASNRARSAGEAVRSFMLSRSLEDEIKEGYRRANQLLDMVRLGKFEVALSKCDELLDMPTKLKARWNDALSVDSKNNWILAQEQLSSIHGVLSQHNSNTLSKVAINKVQASCISVRNIFVEEEAAVARVLDRAKYE